MTTSGEGAFRDGEDGRARDARPVLVPADGSAGGRATTIGIAVINSVGNLAGFVSRDLIGGIIDATTSTNPGVDTLAASSAIGSLLARAMPRRRVDR